jgi:Ser/Thr protein kinase RdoA (MazF antagonist)
MVSGEKPPITDFVSGWGARTRTDDARDSAAGHHAAEGVAGYGAAEGAGYNAAETADRDAGGGHAEGKLDAEGANDMAAGYDGAASTPLGWAAPARRAPAYFQCLPRGMVTSISGSNMVTGIRQNRTVTTGAARMDPLTDDDDTGLDQAGIHAPHPSQRPGSQQPGGRQLATAQPSSPLNAERAATLLEFASRLIDQGCTPAEYLRAIRALPDYGYVLRDRDGDLRSWGYPGEEQGMPATWGGPWPPPPEGACRPDDDAPDGRGCPEHLEVPLLGGDMTDGVVRVGRTVRRPVRPHTPAVHALLRHLEAVGFEGAPRVLGIDAQNREVLTYLPGEVPHRPLPAYALSEATLTRLAGLQLRYHQAVVGFQPPSWAQWDGEVTSLVDGPPELICHCDINLENVIFRPGPAGPEPYALIDFDLARPGTRLVDIIQTLRYWAPLAAPADRDPAFADLDVPARIAVFCQAYGMSYAERARLVPVAVRWMRRSRSTIAARARRHGGAWTRMLEAGVGERLLRSAAWLEASRTEIDERLRRHRLPAIP